MIGGLAVLAAVVADGLVAYTLAELFAAGYEPGTEDAVNGVSWVFLAVASYGHLRLAAAYDLKGWPRMVVVSLVPFVAIYGVLRLEFAGDFAVWDFAWVADFMSDSQEVAKEGSHALLAGVMILPLWVRSALRADDEVDLETLPRQLAVPFTIVTMLVIMGAASDRSGEVARAAVAFYAIGLLALCLSQLSLSGATIGAVRAGETTGLLFGLVVAGVLAALLVLTVTFGLIGPIVGPPLGALLTTVLTWVLTPPAWLLEKALRFLFSGGGFLPVEPPVDILRQEGRPGETANEGDDTSTAVAKTALRVLGLVILFGAVIAAVAVSSRFRNRRASSREGVTAAPAGSLAGDIGDWFRGLRPGAARRRSGGTQKGVYALYAEALRRAGDRGSPRASFATPREFAPVLRTSLQTPVTDEITTVFEEARYGGREPADEDVEELGRRLRES